jgi:hypothetical protein
VRNSVVLDGRVQQPHPREARIIELGCWAHRFQLLVGKDLSRLVHVFDLPHEKEVRLVIMLVLVGCAEHPKIRIGFAQI